MTWKLEWIGNISLDGWMDGHWDSYDIRNSGRTHPPNRSLFNLSMIRPLSNMQKM